MKIKQKTFLLLVNASVNFSINKIKIANFLMSLRFLGPFDEHVYNTFKNVSSRFNERENYHNLAYPVILPLPEIL
jgi:hypothetical protein